MKRIWCKVFGHKWDPGAAEYYHMYHCERCGVEEYDYSTLDQVVWRFRMWFRDTCKSWVQWWRCKDCGYHCGRHTQECEDVPF